MAFALPFAFEHDDHVRILTGIAIGLSPAPGWHPGG